MQEPNVKHKYSLVKTDNKTDTAIIKISLFIAFTFLIVITDTNILQKNNIYNTLMIFLYIKYQIIF